MWEKWSSNSDNAGAPLIDIKTVSLPPRELMLAMQRGEVDMAIGYFLDLKGTDMMQQRLFGHGFVCLVRKNHPHVRGTMTQQQFRDMPHAVVRSEGRSQEIVEQYFKKKGVRRRGRLHCPHFLSIPAVIASTDLVVTVSLPVGEVFARTADVQVIKPPYAIPSYDLKQHWHRCQHEDPGNRWLRAFTQKLLAQ
jgi:DNA-binding transcriptional LysR family regulator